VVRRDKLARTHRSEAWVVWGGKEGPYIAADVAGLITGLAVIAGLVGSVLAGWMPWWPF